MDFFLYCVVVLIAIPMLLIFLFNRWRAKKYENDAGISEKVSLGNTRIALRKNDGILIFRPLYSRSVVYLLVLVPAFLGVLLMYFSYVPIWGFLGTILWLVTLMIGDLIFPLKPLIMATPLLSSKTKFIAWGSKALHIITFLLFFFAFDIEMLDGIEAIMGAVVAIGLGVYAAFRGLFNTVTFDPIMKTLTIKQFTNTETYSIDETIRCIYRDPESADGIISLKGKRTTIEFNLYIPSRDKPYELAIAYIKELENLKYLLSQVINEPEAIQTLAVEDMPDGLADRSFIRSEIEEKVTPKNMAILAGAFAAVFIFAILNIFSSVP